MNQGGNLVRTVCQVVSLLRQAAGLLEAAVNHGNQGESASAGEPAASDQWSLLGTSSLPGSPPLTPSRGGPSAGYSTYDKVAESIPPLPQHCLDLCSRLGGSDSPAVRARRAWQAGHWAKAVVGGKIVKPRPTPKLSQRSTLYIIVQGPRIDKPSKAEAQVYCLALGIDYPAEV